jgi:hypothetical protein
MLLNDNACFPRLHSCSTLRGCNHVAWSNCADEDMSLSEDQIVETFLYGSEILGYEENQILMRNVQLFILQTKRFIS